MIITDRSWFTDLDYDMFKLIINKGFKYDNCIKRIIEHIDYLNGI